MEARARPSFIARSTGGRGPGSERQRARCRSQSRYSLDTGGQAENGADLRRPCESEHDKPVPKLTVAVNGELGLDGTVRVSRTRVAVGSLPAPDDWLYEISQGEQRQARNVKQL
jgi:hypothetical protein